MPCPVVHFLLLERSPVRLVLIFTKPEFTSIEPRPRFGDPKVRGHLAFTPHQPYSKSEESGYSGPESGYSGPESGYSGPESGYSGPESGYSRAESGYSGPESGYGGPESGYSGPESGYSGPESGYSGPESGYSRAESGYSGPESGYSGPESGYSGLNRAGGDDAALSLTRASATAASTSVPVFRTRMAFTDAEILAWWVRPYRSTKTRRTAD
uniref:Uncharacterized protein n=1 Tax=Poecilia mexicana TaxID=48701 RepID=A0A3B3Y6H3_9TELE